MAEIAIHIRANDDATRIFKNVADSVGAFGEACKRAESKVWDFVKGLGAFEIIKSAAGRLRELAAGTLGVASSNELYITTLTTLLGSQEAANQKFKELNDFARATPFQIDGLIKSFINMKSMGLDPTIETMRILGDTTAALGGGEEKFMGISRALGQIQTKGKVSAEELMQLAEQGVPAYEILKQKLGLTAQEVANIGNAGLSSEKAIQALLSGMGDRFGGQMSSMQTTWKGLIEEIKSFWRDFVSLVADAGAFDKLKGYISDLRDAVNEAFDSGKAQEWARSISSAVETAVGTVRAVGSAIDTLTSQFDELFIMLSAGTLTAIAVNFDAIVAALGRLTAASSIAGATIAQVMLPALAALIGYKIGEIVDYVTDLSGAGTQQIDQIMSDVAEEQKFLDERASKYNDTIKELGMKSYKELNAAIKSGSVVMDEASGKWKRYVEETKSSATESEAVKKVISGASESVESFKVKIDNLNPSVDKLAKEEAELYRTAEKLFKEMDKQKGLPFEERLRMQQQINEELRRGLEYLRESDAREKYIQLAEKARGVIEEEIKGYDRLRDSMVKAYDDAMQKAQGYYELADKLKQAADDSRSRRAAREARPLTPDEEFDANYKKIKDIFSKESLNFIDPERTQEALGVLNDFADKYQNFHNSFGSSMAFEMGRANNMIKELESKLDNMAVDAETSGQAWERFANKQIQAIQSVDQWVVYLHEGVSNLNADITAVKEFKLDVSSAQAKLEALAMQISSVYQMMNSVSQPRGSGAVVTSTTYSLADTYSQLQVNSNSQAWADYASSLDWNTPYHGGTRYVSETGPRWLLRGEEVRNPREASRGNQNTTQVVFSEGSIQIISQGNGISEQDLDKAARQLVAKVEEYSNRRL
ncbi:MAG: tape measure protein [Nitrospirota bacterium]